MPTISWNATRTTLTGGRRAGETVSSPLTVAFGLWNASSESSLGIAIPSRTWPPVYQPRTCSEAPRVVLARPSIAASLTGWLRATSRAAQSPTSTCTGAASAATVSGIASAVRW